MLLKPQLIRSGSCLTTAQIRESQFPPTITAQKKFNQTPVSMQHSLSNGQKRMDWGSWRKELVLDLGELLQSPDGLTGGAHIAVGFGERAVQVLLETGRLLPHRQPLLVEAASDLLVLWDPHLELHRRRRRHLREDLELAMEGAAAGSGVLGFGGKGWGRTGRH